ncbi:MAG: hypothetical protein P8Z00_05435 [Anaerolineales bacterium]|jgi:hypothetical protein
MNQQAIPTSLAPEVFIETIQGNLQLKGWDRPEVSVKAQPDDLNLEEQDDIVRLSCQSNCTMRLPTGATVRVGKVQGEASFKYLDDALQIDQVAGELTIRNLSDVQVQSVGGALNARNVTGDLSVEHVAGNANAYNIQGRCQLQKVAGNLELRNLEGSFQIGCNGNVRLRLYILDGESYTVDAGGNLSVEIPDDANINIKLSSAGESIRLRLAGQTQNLSTSSHELTLGEGEGVMQLSAGGSILLRTNLASDYSRDEGRDMDEDFGDFVDLSAQIAQQVEQQMQAVTRQINEQLAGLTVSLDQAGFNEEQRQRILEQARRSGERAQEQARRAQAKLERKLEAARRRGEMKARHGKRHSRRSVSVDIGAQPIEPAPEPVSDEERLLILRMLEQKKISLEEAESLLDALEDKS